MSNKQTKALRSNPIDLNIIENEVILGAGNFIMGFFEGNPVRGSVGVEQFESAVSKLGPDGFVALCKKLDAHAESLGGFDQVEEPDAVPDAVPEGGMTPPTEPATPEPASAPLDDAGKAVILTPGEAQLIGVALHISSAVATGEIEMTSVSAALEVYFETAVMLGLDGQKALADKLNAQFNIFEERA